MTFAGGDLTLNTKKMTAYRNDRAIELSATEYQLLFYLMSNPRQVLSKELILEWVWDTTLVGSQILYAIIAGSVVYSPEKVFG